MQYHFLDTDVIGGAQPWTHDEIAHPAGALAQHPTETEADWLARLAEIGVRPARIEADYNPDTHVPGEPVITEQDGWSVVTHPAPVAMYTDEELTATVRAAKQTEIRDKADAVLQAAGEEYGAMERTGWDQQFTEAQTLQADNAADVPMLSAMASFRGMDVTELAARITANREAWVTLYGNVIGQRLAYQDALDAATTYDEIMAIEVSYE